MSFIDLKKNKLALTLIEVLISTSLFSLFLAVTGMIAIDGIRAFKMSKNKLAAQQSAQMALDRLCRELNETCGQAVRVKKTSWNEGTADYDAICFPTSRTGNEATGTTISNLTTGKFEWKQYVIYFKKFKKTDVYRRVIQVAGLPSDPNFPEIIPEDKTLDEFLSPASPVTLPYTVSGSGLGGNISSEKRIAGEIYNMEFDLYNLPLISISVESRVKTGTDIYGNDTFEFSKLQTSVNSSNCK